MNLRVVFLSFVLLVISVRDYVSAAESHYETYTYYTTISRQNCVLQSSRSCGGWWWGRSCWTNYWYSCSVVFDQILQKGVKCQTGWTSGLCNVPICDPPCLDGKVCTAPNSCNCVTTGGGCQTVPCDANNNCYPGSCAASPTCNCPSGFSGSNCINIDKTPDISSCQVQLYSTGAIFTTSYCEMAGIDPPRNTTWIGKSSISQIQATWTTNYVQPFSLPDGRYAPFLATAPVTIGVSETGFTVSAGGATGIYTAYPIQNGPLSTVNANPIALFTKYGITTSHNLTLKVTVTSKLGAQKVGKNDPKIPGSAFPAQQFVGTPVTRSAMFQFDLIDPVHCLSNPNNDCPVFPIYLEDDITTEATIQPKFYNWTDQGSGIVNFHVEVYFMQPNANNLLVNSQGTVAKDDVDPNKNNFVFICPKSGVYSIELTVQDQAGNSAKARKLLIYNANSKLQIIQSNPVYIQEANPGTGYNWLTKFDDPRNGGNIALTLVWTGHFSSNAQFDNSWGLAAQPWDSSVGIDDRFQNTYGRRSIYAITNMPSGIGAYGVAFTVDQTGGGKGLDALNWVWLNATQSTYSLPVPSLPDGSSLVVWLQCSDVAGGTETVELVVNVDRSPPDVKDATFTENGIDDTTSMMSVQTSDRSSGISQISFAIYDSNLKNKIYSSTSGPQKRQRASSKKRRKRLVQPCAANNDTSCYCIPSGDCYNFLQIVDIDNCELDRLAGHSFEIRFSVTNGANLTSVEQTVQLGPRSLSCRRSSNVAGIVIGCVLGILLLIALIIILFFVIRVCVFKKPVPRILRNVGQTFRGKSHSDTVPRLDENIVYSASDDYKPNNLAKQKKGKQNTDCAGKIEDDYVYNSMNTGSGKSISSKDIDHGDIISEGRFAIIRKGRLSQGRENFDIATKGLKRGFIDADVRLMEEKMALLDKLPRNTCVVQYLGRLDDDLSSGPVMVLEYCDMNLKDWLSELHGINSDVLEEMFNFSSNIANGVKFLHENKVTHRRLAVRNVLLKRQANGLVAKLIGFGPNREDRDGERTSVPIKWLAPETLQTFHSGSPTYNSKTDAWSFGITIWEIFSKGEGPYPNCSSEEVKDLLMKQKKMVLMCPENCPKEFFQNVVNPCWNFKPNKRPEFSKICSNIESFRRGNEDSPQGYYTMGHDNPEATDEYERPPGGGMYTDAA